MSIDRKFRLDLPFFLLGSPMRNDGHGVMVHDLQHEVSGDECSVMGVTSRCADGGSWPAGPRASLPLDSKGVSLSGSSVMSTAAYTSSFWSPRSSRSWDVSERPVGQTSGQGVKPKKSSLTLPSKSLAGTVRPR